MSIADLYKRSRISSRLVEEELYAEALRELERGVRRDGLWAKAFSKSNGNEEKARALYIEFRVQSFKDELALYEMNARSGEDKAEGPVPEGGQQDVQLGPDQERELRIRIKLQERLGREPTQSEILSAKWEGMCLDGP